MTIKAIIEKNSNNYYQISSEDELFDCGFGGYGYSIAEAKADFQKSIEEAKEMAVENGYVLTDEMNNISVEYYNAF